MTEKDLHKIHSYMQDSLRKVWGSSFDDIFFCPDLAESGSKYRKPEPGMILKAIEKHNISPERSWMLGDSESDVIAGKRAGVKTILINQEVSEANSADHTFQSHSQAFDFIQGIIIPENRTLPKYLLN